MEGIIITTRILSAAAALALAAPLSAATPDETAALAATHATLAALSAGDGKRLAALTVPEGWATATGTRDGKPFVRRTGWAEFIARNMAPGGPKLDEWLTASQVRTDGDIATVWGEYALTVDGAFRHCGVDHFDLIRQDGAWKVLNITWSQRTDNCPVKAR